MSLTITLYKNCKLTKEYKEVYRDLSSFSTYLFALTYLEVYSGDDIYYTNSGTISIDNSGLTVHTADTYNYMVFREGTISNPKYRFCFVDSITIVNEVAVISYTEDIWHNYAIGSGSTPNFNINNSMLRQSKRLESFTGCPYTQTQLNELPKRLPVELEGQNAPTFSITEDYPLTTECYVMATISLFLLTQDGDFSDREINSYLLGYKRNVSGANTPLHTASKKLWTINNDMLNTLAEFCAYSSTETVAKYPSVPSDPDYNDKKIWHYEVVDIKLIPKAIGDFWFDDILGPDADHIHGLRPDATLYNSNPSNYIRTLDWDTPTPPTLPQILEFPTDIIMYNLSLNPKYATARTIGDYDDVQYQYNGFEADARPQYTFTVSNTKEYIAIGNLSRVIPITYTGLEKEAVLELSINQYGNRITLYFNNTLTDVSQDFSLDIPIKPQSADTTQQQKIARETANLVGTLGLVGNTINIGTKFTSSVNRYNSGDGDYGDLMSAGAGLITGTMSNIASGYQLNARNSLAYLSNKVVGTQNIAVLNCILGGIRELQCNYENYDLVSQMINKYGYIYQFVVDDYRYFFFTNNFVKFEQANVYGNFTQDIARQIETIFENGVIIL